jgi:alkanesulfonate monooxygenase SsuD/methylene tetrahydromethanopterin reductase-like flavin-dependent oxidoreductase (luciferase family)
LVRAADEAELDLVGIQDHPYQRRFLDTWSLIPTLLAETKRISFFTDVANLPLRPPAVMAKAAASLDVLSGGRFELGLGAGGFGEASQAMGAPARRGAAALDALEEAVTIIRRFWATPERGINYDGTHYQLGGVKAGPPPAHDIGIWIGGYGPRMLRLIGRIADGWVPSATNLTRDDLLDKQRQVDHAADDASRTPGDIRRVLNVGGPASDDPLSGPVDGTWSDQLTRLAKAGFDTFVLWPDGDADDQLRAFAEIADVVRTRVRAAG